MKKTVHSKAQKILQAELVKARQAAGLSQQAVADVLGKPQSFVAKYEGGERRLDVVEFIGVCRALSVQPGKLLKAIEKAAD